MKVGLGREIGEVVRMMSGVLRACLWCRVGFIGLWHLGSKVVVVPLRLLG